MPNQFKAPDGVYKDKATEKDVEGHQMLSRSAPDGFTGGVGKKSAVEDDVEGHRRTARHAPDGFTGGVGKKRAIEDDVEGHRLRTRHAPDGAAKKASPDGLIRKVKAPDGAANKVAGDDEDVEGHRPHRRLDADGTIGKKVAGDDKDVEGHMIGSMNPIMARELARAKERDIQRSTSRGNLISEAKRAIRRKE